VTGAKSVFWVWRRGDGYVGCTRGSHLPGPDRSGPFELLLETEDWGEARALLEETRAGDARHRELVASWDGG
jgi:hypothetical protein